MNNAKFFVENFKKYFAYRFGRFLYIYSFARQNAGGVVVFHLLHVCHKSAMPINSDGA